MLFENTINFKCSQNNNRSNNNNNNNKKNIMILVYKQFLYVLSACLGSLAYYCMPGVLIKVPNIYDSSL